MTSAMTSLLRCRRKSMVAAVAVWILVGTVVTLGFYVGHDPGSRRESENDKGWTSNRASAASNAINDAASSDDNSDEIPALFTDSTPAGSSADVDKDTVGGSWSIDARQVERQNARKRHLANVCASRLRRRKLTYDDRRLTDANGRPVPIEFYGLLVDDERKVIYCEVPKVACSNWKRVLVYASGKTNVTDPGQLTWVDVHGKLGNTILPRLHSFSPEEIRFRLTNYFKFMFVRDPFDRVLSAYNDKFRSSDNMLFNENYGRRIIERYRQNASNESLSRGHDVKFDEFVRYLIDPATREEEQTNKHWYGFEMHWRAFDDICHPCFVGYDFLGKYETLSDDVDHALKLLGIYGQVRFPGLSAAGRVSLRTSATDRDAFLAKGYADISDEDIVGLWRLYFDDFSAFRYSYPSFANAIR